MSDAPETPDREESHKPGDAKREKRALRLALVILASIKESSLYDDYQEHEGFTDAQFAEMYAVLEQLESGNGG